MNPRLIPQSSRHHDVMEKIGTYGESWNSEVHTNKPLTQVEAQYQRRPEASASNDATNIQSAPGKKMPKPPEVELLVYGARTSLDAVAKNRLTGLLRKSLNWNRVIELATTHAVVPLLFRNLSRFPRLVPVEALERLRVLTLKTSIQNLQMAAELSRLVEVLGRNGIASLPFKGPILAISAYGDLSLRQFCDLDILIHKKDIQKAKELFVERGYVPLVDRTVEQDEVFLKARRPYNYKFISANGQVRIELHWEFTSRYNSFPVDYEALFTRLTPFEFAGQQILKLKPEDAIALLCQHGSKHFWVRLLWLFDIVAVVRAYPNLDWKQTIAQAERLGARRMLFLGLLLAERLLDLELPVEVAKRIHKEPMIESLAARVEEQLYMQSRNIEGFETHTFSCSMRERLRDKARYTGYRVFHWFSKATTPTEKDRKALPAALRLSPLAYLIRPVRLSAEAFISSVRPLGTTVRASVGTGQKTRTGDIPDSEFRNYNTRLARFRAQGNSQDAWEERWSKKHVHETLVSSRSGKLEEFDYVFSKYLPRELPILEAGCGLGQLVAALDARGYCVEGVDYAEHTIARIREVAPDLNVRVGDVYGLDAPDGAYGGYISIGVFEHSPEGPLAGLKEARRVLHPSGTALISIPLLNRARARELSRLRRTALTDPTEGLQFYQYYYSREEFEECIRQAGLKVIEMFPYGVYSGITRDLPLGRWLIAHNFYFWQIQKRFINLCRRAPLWARWRWAHMLMVVCQRET